MADLLEEIIAQRRNDINAARRLRPPPVLQSAASRRRHRSLRKRLLKPQTGTPRVIAEIKRASPSAGKIRPDLSPLDLAREYRDHGAVALSILTEPHYFLGSDADIHAIRDTVPLPVLRKDFIVDEYQVLETAALGGDVLLLIVAALDRLLLHDLIQSAAGYHLETLIEIHTEKELDLALDMSPPEALIGVNSRNLKTLQTDLSIAHRLAGRIPSSRIAVAESGIRTAHDIRTLQNMGYRAFLVGESLLKTGNPGHNLRALLAPEPAG